MKEQVTQKNTELAALNERLKALTAQLARLQTSVNTLSNTNYKQSELIAAQKASIRTAWFIVGGSKELVRLKVVDKKGGLLGMGRSSKLSPDFDTNHFTRVDYHEVLNIPINSRKATVVTTHPAGSYVLEKNKQNRFTSLRIIQPEKFWSASKFLVVINS